MGLIGDILGLVFGFIMALITPVIKVIAVGGTIEIIVLLGVLALLTRALGR